jgi:hypothetical protein
MHKRLFIPGPVEVTDDVLLKMATPMIGHRTKESSALQKRISEKIMKVMYTKNQILLSTSSGSGLMEGAVRSCTRKKAAVFSIGAFGDRWHKMALSNRVDADKYSSEPGKPTTPEMIEKALSTGDYDLITITHNETSTGVMNPVEDLAEIWKKYPDVVVCMDTVSSMGGTKIEEITNEVNKIITEFLAFSKPTPQIFNAVLLNEIILSVKYMLESPSFIKGVKLELNLTEFEKPVFADEFQIKQVILNMAKNAIEAMDETNTPLLKISTSLSNSNKEMILKISDNGKGLPKVDLSKLCKPFYTTKEYGTGLGLSTCYRIIKEHNGKISFESKIGKGTTFTIFIPCKSDTKNH